MTLRSTALGILILVVMMGGMFALSELDLIQAETGRADRGRQAEPVYVDLLPEDIRGSFTLGEVSRNFGVPLNVLQQAFRLPPELNPELVRCGDLESLYGGLEGDVEIGTGSVKLFVAFYTGSPYELIEEDYLLADAADILIGLGTLTQDRLAYLDGHTLDVSGISLSEELLDQWEEEVGHEESALMIQGRTTFDDLYALGVSQEAVEEIIGAENPSGAIRTYCEEEGLSYPATKSLLQAEIDRVISE